MTETILLINPPVAPLQMSNGTPFWMAQWKEMISDPQNKIGRPRQLYVGADRRDYVGLDDR